jgi:hypothetical protein
MHKAIRFGFPAAVLLLSGPVSAAGHGEVFLRMNGGDNVAYIGETNTMEVWIKNDAPLSALELSFGFRVNCDGDIAWGEEFRSPGVIGAFDDYSTYVVTSGFVDNLAGASAAVDPYFAFLGGASDHWLPAHDTLTLCYFLTWEVDPAQDEVPNGLQFENIAYDNYGTLYPIGDRFSWSFTDWSGEYAPSFNSFRNESVENPTAPSAAFHVIHRDRSQCCQGIVGDVDGSGDELPTIGDITALIDHLFVSHTALFCIAEADVNQSGGSVSIGDITVLIDHLFGARQPLPDCP